MKANEFVKEFGWGNAVSKIDFLENRSKNKSQDKIDMLNGLKRLVESWELVESVGGWSNATALYDEHLDKDLGRSIADVESCQ